MNEQVYSDKNLYYSLELLASIKYHGEQLIVKSYAV